ncbi:Facilitated trehalose transporter Tret1, partial [Stegodyphus mimosarum]
MSLCLSDMTIHKNNDKKPLVAVVNLRNTHIAAVSAFLYIVVLGMSTAYSAPATVDMKRPGSRFMDITAEEISWIASLPGLSGALGNFVSGFASQKLGRRAVFMYVSTTYVTSWLMVAYASSMTWIYIGRFLTGICAGICAVAAPAYVVEISTTEIRGLLTSGYQIAFSFGVFLVMALGIVLRWSWLAISAAVIAVCAGYLMYMMPESPPWLIRESKNKEAMKGLKFLKGKYCDIDKEFREISDNMAQQPTDGIRLRDVLDPTLYKPLIIAVSLMFFQQLSGVNSLMAYVVDIFESGQRFIDPHVAATCVAAVQVIGTAISGMLMDKAGRKVLFTISGSFMTLSLIVLGLHNLLSTRCEMDMTLFGWVPLVSFVIYMSAFSIGYGPIPFVIAPEIVPIHSRSTVLAVASVSSSLFSFATTKLFDNMRTALGVYGLYWTYAFFALLGCLFCCFFIPETKGKTIHEINRGFSSNNNESL